MDGIDERGTATLEIETKQVRESFVISLAGEVDLSTVERLRAALAEAEASEARQILVDLSGLQFIDGRGLRALSQAQLASGAGSDRMRFLPGGRQVRRIMQITGFDRELRFLD